MGGTSSAREHGRGLAPRPWTTGGHSALDAAAQAQDPGVPRRSSQGQWQPPSALMALSPFIRSGDSTSAGVGADVSLYGPVIRVACFSAVRPTLPARLWSACQPPLRGQARPRDGQGEHAQRCMSSRQVQMASGCARVGWFHLLHSRVRRLRVAHQRGRRDHRHAGPRGGRRGESEWAWRVAMARRCDGRDGNIYAIPANANRVLKLSPGLARLARQAAPASNAREPLVWHIKALDGAIWGMPYNAPSALKIVPETGEISEHGCLPRSGFKWHGGITLLHCRHALPRRARPHRRYCDRRGLHAANGRRSSGRGYLCGGGVADLDGSVWAIPSDSRVLKVSPSNGASACWVGCLRGRTSGRACSGAASDTASPAMRRHPLHPRAHGELMPAELGGLEKKFQGAYTHSDGTVWALPRSCDRILRLVPPETDDEVNTPRRAAGPVAGQRADAQAASDGHRRRREDTQQARELTRRRRRTSAPAAA